MWFSADTVVTMCLRNPCNPSRILFLAAESSLYSTIKSLYNSISFSLSSLIEFLFGLMSLALGNLGRSRTAGSDLRFGSTYFQIFPPSANDLTMNIHGIQSEGLESITVFVFVAIVSR